MSEEEIRAVIDDWLSDNDGECTALKAGTKHLIAELEARLTEKDKEIERLQAEGWKIIGEVCELSGELGIQDNRIAELEKALDAIIWDYDNHCDSRYLDESYNKARKVLEK